MGKLVSGCGQERLLRKGLSADSDVVRLLSSYFDKRVVKRLVLSDHFKIIPGWQPTPYARRRAFTCLGPLL